MGKRLIFGLLLLLITGFLFISTVCGDKINTGFHTPGTFVFVGGTDVKTIKIDLNGDGRPEKVSISQITERGDFLLSVDKISVEGKIGWETKVDGFTIVDIDTSDKYKEIAVHNGGPSDDHEYVIYWYDGKSIRETGSFSGLLRIYGDGAVHVSERMGFWFKTEKYVLQNSTRTLEKSTQEFYYVGIGGTVKEGFPIYKTREQKTVIAYLKPEEKILILLYNDAEEGTPGYFPNDWYLIKSGTGSIGWARWEAFGRKVTDLPAFD